MFAPEGAFQSISVLNGDETEQKTGKNDNFVNTEKEFATR